MHPVVTFLLHVFFQAELGTGRMETYKNSKEYMGLKTLHCVHPGHRYCSLKPGFLGARTRLFAVWITF